MQVIFIPGLLCTKRVWGKLNNIRKKFSCYDADLDIKKVNSIDAMAQSIINNIVCDEIGLIGISMGGYVALDLALKLPDKVKKLVLINTTAAAVDPVTIPYRNKGIQLAENNDIESLLALSAGICYLNPRPEWIMLEREMAYEVGTTAYVKQQQAIINRKSYTNALKDIHADTLVITGRNDQVINYEDSLVLFKDINKSSLLILNECGHLSTIEQSDQVAHVACEFMGT